MKNPFDLTKHFKINKKVFRTGLFIILGLFLITLLVDGLGVIKGVKYIECPEDSEAPCENPFYDPSTSCFNNSFNCCLDDDIFSCREVLFPGEIIGQKPSFLTRKLQSITIFIVILCFLINWMINDHERVKERLRRLKG